MHRVMHRLWITTEGGRISVAVSPKSGLFSGRSGARGGRAQTFLRFPHHQKDLSKPLVACRVLQVGGVRACMTLVS